MPIYYESRLAKLALDEAERPKIDPEFEEATEGEEVERKEKLKTKWAQLEAVVGAEKRLEVVARDIALHFEQRCEHLAEEGIPADLAVEIAGLPLADRGLNILHICADTAIPAIEAAKVYARLGDETGINWVYGRLSMADVNSSWDRMVLVDLRGELLDLQLEITERVLARSTGNADEAVETFLADNIDLLDRVRALQRQATASSSPTALTVITERLRGLMRAS